MHEREEDLTPVERTRRARDETVRRCKTLDGLFRYYRRLEKKFPANIAAGRRLLAEREARRKQARLAAEQPRKPAALRRSA